MTTGAREVDPVVSVILPVYNCSRYVGQAIESILGQTFADLELIIIDDGSDDDTPNVLRRYTDPRIRLIQQANGGLARALNRGIGLSRGRFIGRQDSDDESFPGRLSKQVAFLSAHPNCALIGTWAEIWQRDERSDRTHAFPSDNVDLKFALLLDNPFVHSSVMIRRTALDQVGWYCTDPGRQPPEDYELWSRIARVFDVANLPEILHVYREVEGSVSRLVPSPFTEHLVTICAENMAWAADVPLSNPDVINIAALFHRAYHRVQDRPDMSAMRDLLGRAATRISPNDGRRLSHATDRYADVLRDRSREMRYGKDWRRHIIRAGRGATRFAKHLGR